MVISDMNKFIVYDLGEPLIDELRNCISNTNKDTVLLCIFNSWSHEPGQLQHMVHTSRIMIISACYAVIMKYEYWKMWVREASPCSFSTGT